MYEYRMLENSSLYKLKELVNIQAEDGWRAVNISVSMAGALTLFVVMLEREVESEPLKSAR